MNWQAFWDRQASGSNPQTQVGRVRGGSPVSETVLEQITEYLAELLDLQPEDELLDVCCGNGWLTERLALRCRRATGVDLSGEQILLAKARHSETVFLQGDATRLGEVLQGSFDKISLYFSFQYLDSYNLGQVAIGEMLSLLKPGGHIVIGDVPDRRYLQRFYPKIWDRLRYHFRFLLGRNDMGKFWSEKEMKRICLQLGARCERREQPTHLPYAHYRCDYLIFPDLA